MGNPQEEETLHNLAQFLYELGQLKRVQRSGWWVAGISQPESVAEHTMRTAQLGYILATLEGADPQQTATMCLFHDLHETRINDQHRMGKHYIQTKPAEEQVTKDQMARLPAETAAPLTQLITEYEQRQSPEAIIAKDADLLECLIQAREYQTQLGNANMQEWIDSNFAAIKTESAKRIATACLQTNPAEWWQFWRQNSH
jgi:putative hydrolase of HD superfamily